MLTSIENMKVSEILKESNAMGAVGLSTSRHQGIKGAEPACWILGCLNPATTFLSSAWYPDVRWLVCDDCESTVDLSVGESCHENSVHGRQMFWSQPRQATSSFHGSPLSLFKESYCCQLQSVQEKTILSKVTSYNFIKNSFETLDENADCATKTWYQFEKVLSLRKLASPRRNKKCEVEGCTLDACSLWSTWKRSETFDSASMSRMSVCVDCQEEKFGGWPSLHGLLGKGYMTEEKLEIIASKCSKQQRPTLPPAFIKSLN